MSDVPFYQTRTGRQFYEATMPELVRQIARLNDLLDLVVEKSIVPLPPTSGSDHRKEPKGS